MAERDWREAADLQPSRAGLVVVLAAAAILRFWELGHGIPHAIGTEEPEIVDRAFQMMRAGSMNPGFYDYGQLHIALQLGVSIVRFVLGSMSGEWFGLDAAAGRAFYPWARALIALFGVLTVLVLFRVGQRWGARAALIGAALLAVLPLHVRYSQLAVPDVLHTLLATLVLSVTLTATDRRNWTTFALSGVVVGLTMATRYSGITTLLMPLVACWLTPAARPSRPVATIAIFLGVATGFLVAAPYTLIELPAFLERFAQLTAAARDAAQANDGLSLVALLQAQFAGANPSAWLLVATWPVIVLAFVGIALAAWRSVRGPGRTPCAVAVAYVLGHIWLSIWMGGTDARMLLPIMPIVCLLIGVATVASVNTLRSIELARPLRTSLMTATAVLTLVPGTVASVRYAHDRSKPSTEDMAYDWVRKNVPSTAVVIVEAAAMSIPRGVVQGHGVPELSGRTYDDLARDGVHYVIASSSAYAKYMASPSVYRDEYQAYTRLFSEAQEVARFTPSSAHPGPELRVLRILP